MIRATIKVSIPGTPAQPGSGGESPGDAGRSRRFWVIGAGNPAQSDPRPNVGRSEPSSDTPDDMAERGPQIVCPPSGEGHEGDLPESIQTVPPSGRRIPAPDAAHS